MRVFCKICAWSQRGFKAGIELQKRARQQVRKSMAYALIFALAIARASEATIQ